MKITKILVALSFLFAVSTAHAGEMTVTGSMVATYQSEVDRTTGNPLGMDREIKFAGSTETDSGIAVSVMQDFGDDGAFGDSKITFAGVGGIVDLYVGSDGSELDAIDDITPTAYEEANGAGSGTYQDVGGLAGETGIGFKAALPLNIGTLSGQYVPKADAAENGDKTASGDASGVKGTGMELVLKTSLGDLPGAEALSGINLTLGIAEEETTTVANTSDRIEATAALTGSLGNFKYGYQVEHIDAGQTAAATDAVFYNVESIGLAYAINDALSISYNTMEQKQHSVTADSRHEQSTDAISIGYTVGGFTLGFQDASTDHANMVRDAKDDTRTISVAVAF